MEKIYVKTCNGCGVTHNPKDPNDNYCGLCRATTQCLMVHYQMEMQRWGCYPANPNPLVEKVLNNV